MSVKIKQNKTEIKNFKFIQKFVKKKSKLMLIYTILREKSNIHIYKKRKLKKKHCANRRLHKNVWNLFIYSFKMN